MHRILLASLAIASPLLAQPNDRPTASPAATHVAAGSYAVEPHHTQVTFTVSHLGISPFSGSFSNAWGSLSIDPARPDKAKVTVSMRVDSVMTTSTALTGELKSADWFDAARYPVATFASREVRTQGDRAVIDGTLTLHGATRPLTVYARLFGAAVNPMSKAPSLGFVGHAMLKRSEFGITEDIPLVSDEVELVMNVAFEKR